METTTAKPRIVKVSIVTGVSAAAFGIFMFAASFNFDSVPIVNNIVGPATLPRIYAVCLTVAGLAVAVHGVLDSSKARRIGNNAPTRPVPGSAGVSEAAQVPGAGVGDMAEDAAGELGDGADVPQGGVPQDPRRVVAVAVLVTGYVVVISFLGFLLSTPLFLFATATYFDRRRIVRNAIFAVALTFVVYFAFTLLLDVYIPSGVLGVGVSR